MRIFPIGWLYVDVGSECSIIVGRCIVAGAEIAKGWTE